MNYPLNYNSISFKGPALIYIDQEGTPIQLGLTNEEAQTVIDAWNTNAFLEHEVDGEADEKAHQLKPPLDLTKSGKECTCHKFIRLHDGNCDVHGFVRKQEAVVTA